LTRFHLLASAAVLGGTCALQLGAQTPEVTLRGASASPDEPFTEISDVVELRGGRVLVADGRERRLVILDLGSGSARGIGRTGAGPGEFQLLGQLVARASGGAWLADGGLRRLLPVEDDGSFGTPVRFPASILVRGADERGNAYGEQFLPRTATGMRDSMRIVRWNVATERFDTLMQYNAGVSSWTGLGGQGLRLYDPVDTWLPLPNGDILVAQAAGYRIAIWRDGRVIRSFTVPWEPIRVTDAEKQAVLDRMTSMRTLSMGPAGTTPSRASEPRIDFPDTYPPFGGEGGGGRYLRYAPIGHVWVERLRAASDSMPAYDVVDVASGRLVLRVRLRPRDSLVALGRQSIYVSERDADDVARLRAYPYPSVP
jgi:hypothetical protein